MITINGIGFDESDTKVTVCGNLCEVFSDTVTATKLTCVTPAKAPGKYYFPVFYFILAVRAHSLCM